MFPETIQIFRDWKVAEAVPSTDSEFGHHFGGPVAHSGLAEAECGFPIHLLCLLNTRDPLVGAAVPGAEWLPLYYCFNYENRSMRMAYRIESHKRAEAFFELDDRLELDEEDRFPTHDYPDEFSVTPLTLQPVAFDPSNPEDVAAYVNAFGIGSLADKDREAFLADRKRSWDAFAPEPWTGLLEGLLDYQAGPACQGRPRSCCGNPECPNHTEHGRLDFFALVPAKPVPEIRLWGEYGDDTQILFEICPLCSTIVVTSQCS